MYKRCEARRDRGRQGVSGKRRRRVPEGMSGPSLSEPRKADRQKSERPLENHHGTWYSSCQRLACWRGITPANWESSNEFTQAKNDSEMLCAVGRMLVNVRRSFYDV